VNNRLQSTSIYNILDELGIAPESLKERLGIKLLSDIYAPVPDKDAPARKPFQLFFSTESIESIKYKLRQVMQV
jgi:hypothetical protein